MYLTRKSLDFFYKLWVIGLLLLNNSSIDTFKPEYVDLNVFS